MQHHTQLRPDNFLNPPILVFLAPQDFIPALMGSEGQICSLWALDLTFFPLAKSLASLCALWFRVMMFPGFVENGVYVSFFSFSFQFGVIVKTAIFCNAC
jgi:hypothetical protein